MIEHPARSCAGSSAASSARSPFPAEGAEKIRRAAERGTVVYVCKTLSYIDYLYFSYAFLKYALPLSRFANGVKTLMMQPIGRILRARSGCGASGARRRWRSCRKWCGRATRRSCS